MRIRSAVLVSLALAGCQSAPLRQVPYGFARGGALTDEDYARLEPFGRSQVWSARLPGDSASVVPAARYAYSFAPGFDPKSITLLEVRPFHGKTDEATKIAAQLPAVLAKTLTNRGLRAVVGSTSAPDGFSISGAVTRADPVATVPDGLAIQIEARVTQGDKGVGAIQINFIHSEQSGPVAGPPAIMIGMLIGRALAPNLVEMASTLLSNPFRQVALSGARQGVSGEISVVVGMMTRETGYGEPAGKAGVLDIAQPQRAALQGGTAGSAKAAP